MENQTVKNFWKPCLLIAEIGINHNGDMELAKEMVRKAAEAGADAVKFQNYLTEDFLTDSTLTYTYTSRGKQITESQYEMFKRCELSEGSLGFLKLCCEEFGVLFFSTPTNADGVDELGRLGAAYLKNGSDYLGHLPLIRHMARSGIPTILSTGMAVESEIADAAKAFRESGGEDLTLMACTSAYPTSKEHVKLRRIPMLAEKFRCKVGFSDHTQGWEAAVAAVCLGATMIEKHFTSDRDLPGPDQWFSSDPREFSELVGRVREVELMLGSPELRPSDAEIHSREEYRLSCVAIRDLPRNHIISEGDIAFRRPATGIPPGEADQLSGRKLVRDVRKGEPFKRSDFS